MTTTRIRSLFALATVAALALAGCSSADPSTPGGSTPGGSPAAPGEAIVDNATVAALTGKPIEAGSLAHPALSAKIDNAPQARPQWGLDETDIVFEELVEGGMTRYVAIWHSILPLEAGPVRSVRPMDVDIVSPFGGVFVYSGGQERFVNAMRAAPVVNVTENKLDADSSLYRTNKNIAPHNVVVKVKELVAKHLDRPAPPKMFDYADDVATSSAVLAGNPLESINTQFSGISSPTWEWSEEQGKFLRFIRYSPTRVPDLAASGSQLAATNVIVLFVQIDVIEDIPTTRLVSQGKGWVATGGSIIEINWFKATAESPIVLTTNSGESVLLAQGNSWIEMLPAEGSGVDAGFVNIR